MKAQEIRERFAKFFMNHGHEKISSSPLIPQNDPTLLFANAGMNQFKDNFTGKANPKNKRAVTIQKCVRAGGKHNDLENVGFTARHHTFFEMLGNFSFGDYFKKEAIDFAWKFLTEDLKIPKEKLYVTVHESDQEAADIWHNDQGIPRDRIFFLGDKDNFWEMGDTGPCGPCSEIFYDHGPEYSDGTDNSKMLLLDEGRYVEIWNLVFMQYEKYKEGDEIKRRNLPKPSVDTGAGLERIAAALQGKYWNYDSDLFDPIRSALENISGKKYSDSKYVNNFRVVADHIRSSTMLITDGVIPSNEGRGYVLRRIIRRAVRHLRELEAPKGSMAKLVPSVFESLGKEYPQNKQNEATAIKFLELEESKFLETLDQGIKFLNEAMKTDMNGDTLKGSAAFKLYDTFGFPLDLTEVILKEKNLKLDTKGFEEMMEKRKEDSRKSWKTASAVDNKVFHSSFEKNGNTNFVGYNQLNVSSKLLDIIDIDDDVKGLVFNQTSFYGESGGQVGDKGLIKSGDDVMAEVFDVQKPVESLFVHFCKIIKPLKVGENYDLSVDSNTRALTMRNHSATHLLQSALLKVLGKHVKQAGSQVSSEKLRFDFTHTNSLSSDEIIAVEKIVNEYIQNSIEVSANEMTMDEALEAGALAFFGDKYGDKVRVLQMGEASVELCGGTHVKNTGDIGLFKILSEGSLSSGVRRIEALTSTGATQYLMERSNLLSQLESKLNDKGEKVITKVDSLLAEIKNKQKEIKQLNDKIQSSQANSLFDNVEKFKEVSFVITEAPKGSDLRKLSDNFTSKFDNGILVIYTENKGKLSALIRSSKSVDINCGEVLREALKEANGRGGGRPDMAQGSGDFEGASKFASKAKEIITSKLN